MQSKVEEKLGVVFTNKDLLKNALTHKSFAKQKANKASVHNERLEFLGDAVLKLIVSELLYEKYPGYEEGALTKIRAHLISDQFLSEVALGIALGEHMLFSYGEVQTGGKERSSNLANAMEAVLGACYLDQGFSAASDLYVRLIQPYGDSIFRQFIDYKSTLQEWLQQRGDQLPTYKIEAEEGPDHDKIFRISVHLKLGESESAFMGEGNSKKAAQQDAAAKAIAALNPTLMP